MSTVDDSEYKMTLYCFNLLTSPILQRWRCSEKNKRTSVAIIWLQSIGCFAERIKTPEELALLRKSVTLSAVAHAEVMRNTINEMSETEIEGMFEYVHKKYGAEAEGYPRSLVPAHNGCILHYIENNVTRVDNQLGADGCCIRIPWLFCRHNKNDSRQRQIYQ